jgi:hypothetical protein
MSYEPASFYHYFSYVFGVDTHNRVSLITPLLICPASPA